MLETVVIGVITLLIVAASTFYLYSRLVYSERKISLMENITWDSEKSKDFLDNEPASFESLDSKSSMLLNNLSKTQIINEPISHIRTSTISSNNSSLLIAINCFFLISYL